MDDPIVAYLIQLDAVTTQIVQAALAYTQAGQQASLAPLVTALDPFTYLMPPPMFERLHGDAVRLVHDWQQIAALVMAGAPDTQIVMQRRTARTQAQQFLAELDHVQRMFNGQPD